MAEELVMTIKSNIKGVTKDTKDLNNTLSEQKKILLELQQEEVALQQKRAKMNAYERSLSGIDKQLEHINLSIKDQKLAVKGLTQEQSEAVKEQKEYNKQSKETNKQSKETIADFSVMGVSLNSVKRGFSQIIPTAKAMFGTIKAGVMSTGIGALVIAVVALAQSFKRSEEGQEKFQRIMAAIGAVTTNLADAFADLGEIIINTFKDPMPAMEKFGKGLVKFLKDPTGATRDMFVKATIAAKGFVAQTVEEVDAIDKITIARQKAHHIDRALKVERAEANRKINDLRLQAEDREANSAEDRIKLLRKAQKIEQDITDKEIESKKILIDAQILEMKLFKNTKEDKDKLAQLQADLINLDTKRLRSQRLLQTQITTANNQAISELEAQKKAAEDLFDAQMAQAQAFEDNVERLRKKADADEEIRKQKEKNRREAKLAHEIDMANLGLQTIANAAGQGTEIAKAAAIAQATISGVQGVQNAFTAANANIGATAGTFGAYPVTMAALAGTFAAMNIAKIASGGGGGVTPPSTPPPTVQTPAPQMMSGAFELSGGVVPEAMRAFVVTDEMTNSQNQLANIRRRATI